MGREKAVKGGKERVYCADVVSCGGVFVGERTAEKGAPSGRRCDECGEETCLRCRGAWVRPISFLTATYADPTLNSTVPRSPARSTPTSLSRPSLHHSSSLSKLVVALHVVAWCRGCPAVLSCGSPLFLRCASPSELTRRHLRTCICGETFCDLCGAIAEGHWCRCAEGRRYEGEEGEAR